ncbi:MAG: YebC/PmpR family DNA-binding transcriptional regulator [Candidatus Saganbacteria bacterium]|nr:YebC/PmpR family DNA-binding transcriptional regulator [Candidatus Saganbacteria bacterium]
MSGHSKWATIKRSKGKTDAARGKVFTKIIREIGAAAKIGGGDPNGNPRLRLAIDKAKQANMPNDNIKRAIERGIGGGEGSTIEEISFEGYGPAGVAIIAEAMTDNRNRTVPEIRNMFAKYGGNLGTSGAVSFIFHRKGIILFDKKGIDADTLGLEAIEAGAEDIDIGDELVEVVTKPEEMEKIRDGLKAKGFNSSSSEVTMSPSTMVAVAGEDAKKVLSLMEALEEHDDIQNVYSNADIAEEAIKNA